MRSSTLASAIERAGAPASPSRAGRRRRTDGAIIAAGIYLALLVAVAAAAPWVTSYPYDQQDLEGGLRGPTRAHPLGTDQFGRDLLTRLAFGARASLLVASVAVTTEASVGAIWGTVAALHGGRVDAWLMRVVDLFIAFPPLLLALLITGIFGPGLRNVVIALVLTAWPGMARLVRSEVLVLRDREFVEAARAAGASTRRIVQRHLLPNVLHLVVARGTLDAGVLILIEATLSFVGVGVQPPQPSWGLMIQDAFGYMRSAPYLLVIPSIVLSLTVIALSVVGEGFVDRLDPRRRARG